MSFKSLNTALIFLLGSVGIASAQLNDYEIVWGFPAGDQIGAPFTSTPEPTIPAVFLPFYIDEGASDGAIIDDTPAMYTGQAIGDLAFITVESANDFKPTIAGWTEVPCSDVGTGAGCPDGDTCTNLTVWYQILAGTNPTRLISINGGDHIIHFTFGFKGGSFNAADPFENNCGTNTQAATTALSNPGFVSENDNSMIVTIFATPHDGNGSFWVSSIAVTGQTNPWTGVVDGAQQVAAYTKNTGDGGGNSVILGIKPIAGATGTLTGTGQWAHTSVSISFGINGEPNP